MKQTVPTVIGSRSLVDFPKVGIFRVPAKVDTGADSSSIWATKISESEGELSFALFGPSSPHYTGQIIRTKDYSIRSVKNSFGASETRYKVVLSLKLAGRQIKARFTLANRENNRYPILIGRQTLKRKFVVDVAQSHNEEMPTRAMVLMHVGREGTLRELNKMVARYDGRLEVDAVRYDDLMMVADTEDARLSVRSVDRDVASYDFIFFLTRVKDAELAAMIAAYAKRRMVNFSDQAALLLATDTKAHQALLLSGRGVSIPKTIYMDRGAWKDSYKDIASQLGKPFIFKDNNGLKGRNNYLIKSKKDFDSACRVVNKQALQMVAQTFIPNDGYYRIVVMGNQPVLAMHRSVDQNHSHLFDKDHSGPARKVALRDLPADPKHMAVTAAGLLSIDVAGVDVLQDKHTGVWYCLEVNNSPQLVGGAFVEEKMRELGAFFLREARR